jgi:hypothetical protein
MDAVHRFLGDGDRADAVRTIDAWLRSQGRLRHLLGGEIDVIRRRADEDWQAMLGRCENVESHGVDHT